MGSSRCIGRVGALAVALGIGSAVAWPMGVAAADPDTSTSSEQAGPAASSSADEPPPARSLGKDGRARNAEGSTTHADPADAGESDTGESDESESDIDVPTDDAPTDDAPTDDESTDASGAAAGDDGSTATTDSSMTPRRDEATPRVQSVQPVRTVAETPPAAPREQLGIVGATDLSATPDPADFLPGDVQPGIGTHIDENEPEPTTFAQGSRVSILIDNLLAPVVPGTPAESPALLALLAFARRESREQSVKSNTARLQASTGQSLSPTVDDLAPATGPITVGEPGLFTGIVRGRVSADDPDGGSVRFRGTDLSADGLVIVSSSGRFTYLPSSSARHTAALVNGTVADKTYTFTVTATDSAGESTQIPVTVQVPPSNSAPFFATGRAGSPNSTTGAVQIRVTALDFDGDSLVFAAPAATSKGTIVDLGGGRFTYTPTAAARYTAFTGSRADRFDTVSVSVSDGHGGSITEVVRVSISPLQRPADVSTSPGATSYTEQQSRVVVDSGIQVNDVNSPTYSGASATLATVQSGDELTFTSPAGSGITGAYDRATGVLTLTGAASAASYQAALRTVSFNSTTDAPSASKTVAFAVALAGVSSSVATKTIAITAVNDTPVVSTTGSATAYSEQGPSVVVDGGLTIADPDSPSLSGATVTVGSVQTGDTLGFTAPTGSGISGSYNASTGVLTLSGTSSVANYQSTLRSVYFRSTSDIPVASKIVSFAVSDGSVTSAAASKTVTTTAVNDAPALGGGGGQVVAAPGSTVKVVPSITVADPDSATLTGATVAITAGRQVGGDVLSFTPAGGITGSFDGSTGVLTLSGSSSVANYQAALRSVTFANISATPSEATRTISVTVTDGALTGTAAAVSLTVRVSHTPVAANDQFTSAEDKTSAGNVLGNDVDSDGDTLVAILGTSVSHGTLVLNSNGNFSYTPNVNYHGTDSFTYTATDGTNTSNTAIVTLTITAVDDVLFQFTYGTGSEYWTPEAKAALQRAADRISELIATPSPVTMTYNVEGRFEPDSSYAARAGSNFTYSSLPGFYNEFANKVMSANHVDSNGALPDGNIYWNFANTFSYDNSPAFNETDFESVAVHELMHSFGYTSALNSRTTGQAWLKWDSFVVDQNGNKVIGTDFRFKEEYLPNLNGSNGGLFFAGPNALAAYGAPVPLQAGSLSHLSASAFPYNGPVSNRKVMSPSLLNGTILRTLSPVELAILADLGYKVVGVPPIAANSTVVL